jgi:hypothetical protein
MVTYIIARPTKSEKATPILMTSTHSQFLSIVGATMRLPTKDLELCYRLSTWAAKKRISLACEKDYAKMIKEYSQVVEQKLKTETKKKKNLKKNSKKAEGDEDAAGVTISICDERPAATLKVCQTCNQLQTCTGSCLPMD